MDLTYLKKEILKEIAILQREIKINGKQLDLTYKDKVVTIFTTKSMYLAISKAILKNPRKLDTLTNYLISYPNGSNYIVIFEDSEHNVKRTFFKKIFSFLHVLIYILFYTVSGYGLYMAFTLN